jgi:hypothetical protein
LSEGEFAEQRAAMEPEGVVVAFRPHGGPPGHQPVTFTRAELGLILNLYGRMVAAGEWRDYAMDFSRDKAVFSVFRRTSEMPLYRIVKNPELARRQGAWAVIASAGQVLKRGHDLARLLTLFDKPVRLVT